MKSTAALTRGEVGPQPSPYGAATLLSTILVIVLGVYAMLIAPVSALAVELPDGRVYEEVSPVEKHGNEAGASSLGGRVVVEYAKATADGSKVLYGSTGPFGSVSSGADFFSTSTRATEAGWETAAVTPPPYGRFVGQYIYERPLALDPSADLTGAVFTAGASYAAADPVAPAGAATSEGVFYSRMGGAAEWLSQPSSLIVPQPEPGAIATAFSMVPAGGAPDLSVVYFGYSGTLLPQDVPRVPFLHPGSSPWGYYEWKDGTLAPASVLPSGTVDPLGAIPAGGVGHFNSKATPDDFDNQVSEDGSRAFFVSPDPASLTPLPAGDPPELYVREHGQTTLLISKDVLEGGVAAPGPEGSSIVGVISPDVCGAIASCEAYAYASPDGSRVFFESADKLAKSSTGADPSATGPWAYEFEVDSGVLRYLPGVTDGIGGRSPVLASSRDGARFLFAKDTGGIPSELDLSLSGSIVKITDLPRPPVTSLPQLGTDNSGKLYVAPARATADGSVFVFETDSPLPGAFNNQAGYNEVYRYEVASQALTCVSCPASGVAQSGDARLSNDDDQIGEPVDGIATRSLIGSRGISADGSRVFFDTPDALATQDVNNQRDVYEWENGNRYLISSGISPQASVFLDNSESGDDVFFATIGGLSAADGDGAYDVYDARVGAHALQPHASGACTSDCEAPPSPPPAFDAPATVLISGSGDLPASLAKPVVKQKASKKRKAKKPPKPKKSKQGKQGKQGKEKSKKAKRKPKHAKQAARRASHPGDSSAREQQTARKSR